MLVELVGKVGMDLVILEDMINKYNFYVDVGYDLEFGKSVFYFKCEVVLFYVILCKLVIYYMMGGLVIDEYGYVLDKVEWVIVGLYFVGENVGGFYVGNWFGGNLLVDIFIFGCLVVDIVV